MSNFETLQKYTIAELRVTLSNLGGAPNNKKKNELIDEILKIQSGEISAKRSNRGRPSERTKRAENGEYYFTGVKPSFATLNDFTGDTALTPESCFGYLEILSDGYGFLHKESFQKESSVYVPLPVIKVNGLRTGDYIEGSGKLLKDRRVIELSAVESVNGHAPNAIKRLSFLQEEPLCPSEQIVLGGDLSVLDKIAPIGMGQRVALLSKSTRQIKDFTCAMLDALSKNQSVKTILYLADERPEQVSFYKSAYPFAELFYSTFDKEPEYRAHVGEIAFARATALAEEGNNVVIIVNTLTKLLKALLGAGGLYVADTAVSQRAVSAVLRYFGLARSIKNGSLTVIGAISTDIDAVACQILNSEVLQLANSKIVLDALLFEDGFTPAVDLLNSFTEDYELLLKDKTAINLVRAVKKALRGLAVTNQQVADMITTLPEEEVINKLKG